jgi:predicted GIY-YIG superfamily endonuclease
MIYIYVLENKGCPVYIGKTINIEQRFKDHLKIKQIDNYFIVDEVGEEDWIFWEKHYINLFKSWGFILLNENDGGGGCKIGTKFKKLRTKEHSNKISQSKKGKSIHSEEQKLKWKKERAGQKIRLGKKDSLETIEKRKKSRPKHNIKPHSNKGIPLKDEHKIKCAENKYKSVLIFKDNQLIKECISIKETAVFLKCSKGNISQNLKGKTKTCKGYIIKYK